MSSEAFEQVPDYTAGRGINRAAGEDWGRAAAV